MALKGKPQNKLNAVMYAMMLEELLSGPCTAQAIAEYTGMHTLTVRETLRTMHRKGVVHIAGWEEDARGAWSIRVFGLGHGRDKPKPAPKTSGGKCKAKRRPSPASIALRGTPFAGLAA